MQARDIMTRNVITVLPEDTVQQLARVLTDAGISGAPVLDHDGNLVGIVSEADVISKRGGRITDVMHRDVVTVHEDTSVEQVCETMTRYNINRIPVMGDRGMVGIITRNDVVRAIAHGCLEAETLQATATFNS